MTSRRKESLFYVAAVVDFVLDAKRPLLLEILPALLRDQAVRLRQALGGQRMRAEISLQTLDGQFRQLFFGTASVDHVFAVQFAEFLEQAHGAVGRVSD